MSKTAIAVLLAVVVLPASAEEIRDPSPRIEVVPPQPRPLADPKTSAQPVVTVGTSEKYLPDPNKAHHDGVSPTSREHLETLIRDLKKR